MLASTLNKISSRGNLNTEHPRDCNCQTADSKSKVVMIFRAGVVQPAA